MFGENDQHLFGVALASLNRCASKCGVTKRMRRNRGRRRWGGALGSQAAMCVLTYPGSEIERMGTAGVRVCLWGRWE